MNEQPDLFDHRAPPKYPDAPGFKEGTTSRDAAKAIAPAAANLREQVYAAIVRAGSAGLTADEAAAKCGMDVLNARPRVTELSACKRIKRSGMRRPSSTGTSSIVWIVNEEGCSCAT